MDLLSSINAVWVSLGGWAMLWCIFHLFYRSFNEAFVDECRQEIFRARDEIFLLAHTHDIDQKTHNAIRDELNLFIRYAHKVTWTRLLFAIHARRYANSKNFSLFDQINLIDDKKVKESFLAISERAMVAVADLMVKRSFLLRCVTFIIRAKSLTLKLFNIKRGDVLVASEDIVRQAYEADRKVCYDPITA